MLFPSVDDYVFLKATKANEVLLTKQGELGVSFLREGTRLKTVTALELAQIQGSTVDLIQVGTEVEVVGGYCANLEGRVVSVEGQQARCELKGYNRMYDVMVDMLDLAVKLPAGEPELMLSTMTGMVVQEVTNNVDGSSG